MDDYLVMYYTETIGFLLMFSGLILGSCMLLRKDRSIGAWMISLGGSSAFLAAFGGHVIYLYLTRGLLFISESDPGWDPMLFWDHIVVNTEIIGGLTAVIGFILFVRKLPRVAVTKE